MKYIIAVLILFSPFYALSQSKFYKGSLITNNGKELIGYISFHESNENPQNIDFKDSLNKMEATRYYPSSIKSFNTIKDGTYNSYHGRISTDAVREGDLKVGIDSSSTLDFVFLKLITTGKYLSLYSYRDRVKVRYFIKEKDAQPYELLYRRYYDAGMVKIRTENRYAGQLNALIVKYSSNTDLLNKTMSTNYNDDDLSELVDNINGTGNKKKASSYSTFYLGGAIYTTRITSNITTYKDAISYNTVKLSTGFDIGKNQNTRSFTFRANIGLSYDNPQLEITYNDFVTHHSFKRYNASLTALAIYNFYQQKSVNIYIASGLGLNQSFYTNIENTAVNPLHAQIYTDGLSLNKGGIYLPLQVGMVLNNRIELFSSAAIESSLFAGATNTQVYGLGLHYWFKKTSGF